MELLTFILKSNIIVMEKKNKYKCSIHKQAKNNILYWELYKQRYT